MTAAAWPDRTVFLVGWTGAHGARVLPKEYRTAAAAETDAANFRHVDTMFPPAVPGDEYVVLEYTATCRVVETAEQRGKKVLT